MYIGHGDVFREEANKVLAKIRSGVQQWFDIIDHRWRELAEQTGWLVVGNSQSIQPNSLSVFNTDASIAAAERLTKLIPQLQQNFPCPPTAFVAITASDAEKATAQQVFDAWWQQHIAITNKALDCADIVLANSDPAIGMHMRRWYELCTTPKGREENPWGEEILANVLQEAKTIATTDSATQTLLTKIHEGFETFRSAVGDSQTKLLLAVQSIEPPDRPMSVAEIAAAIGAPDKAEAIRKKLERSRHTLSLNDVEEVKTRGRGQEQYRYRLSAVRHLLKRYDRKQ